MIQITTEIQLHESDLTFSAVRASGPGGQHVNKTATAVQLRLDLNNCTSIPEQVRERLLKQQHRRISKDGFLIINACTGRSQFRNRQDAMEKLTRMIEKAILKPVIRRKTRPGRAAREKRLENKKKRALVKQSRKPVDY